MEISSLGLARFRFVLSLTPVIVQLKSANGAKYNSLGQEPQEPTRLFGKALKARHANN